MRDEAFAEACSVHSWGATHAGAVRPINQDSFLARDELGLWVVADGAGGHHRGAAASQAIVAKISELPPDLSGERVVTEVGLALQRTHAELRRAALAENRQTLIATTVVALIIHGDTVTCLWAGDSRAYRFRAGRLACLTRDHSLVQEMVSAGTITPAEALRHPQRNIITRAVGADCDRLALERLSGDVLPGDLFLLCSDGLSGTLEEAEIAEALGRQPDGVANALIQAALAGRADDNVTAVVVVVPA